MRQRGIVFEKTEPYTPRQNGLAEWTNSLLMNKVRAMMHSMTVPTKCEAEAISTAVRIRNLTPLKLID